MHFLGVLRERRSQKNTFTEFELRGRVKRGRVPARVENHTRVLPSAGELPDHIGFSFADLHELLCNEQQLFFRDQ